jgi:hypothetical protein
MPAANSRRCVREDKYDFPETDAIDTLTVECICPKCGIHHKMKLLWTGRGRPKKYCQPCKTFVTSIEPIDFYEVPSNINKGLEKAAS